MSVEITVRRVANDLGRTTVLGFPCVSDAGWPNRDRVAGCAGRVTPGRAKAETEHCNQTANSQRGETTDYGQLIVREYAGEIHSVSCPLRRFGYLLIGNSCYQSFRPVVPIVFRHQEAMLSGSHGGGRI